MGIKVSEAMAGGNYMNATDVTTDVSAKIVAIDMEDPGDGQDKICVRFEGLEKVLLLNRTNADTLVDLFGDDTDGWVGKDIVLYCANTTFGKNRTRGIRLRGTPAASGSSE